MNPAGMIEHADAASAVVATAEAREVAPGDADLVAAVRRGDDRAFERLYARYHRRISTYVAGMVQDHGRAEDVTQEVFISALRRMRQTERPITFRPWVYEIAKNACIDAFRRSRRAEEVSLEAQEDAGTLDTSRFAASSPSADVAMDAKQRLDDLCGAFDGLSDTHHQILVLRELEGLTYSQIGERLGLSRPSVESTLFRARRRLSEEYDELASGERCRAVQELVAGGLPAVGGRDKRRLARHIAHCQTCRRAAHLAGVDTQTLTSSLRSAATRRVAALLPLPLPALLRMRRDANPGSWTGHAMSVTEPAVNWAKAAITAGAMLAAGGAGVVGHQSATPPAGLAGSSAPAQQRPAPEPRAAHGSEPAPRRVTAPGTTSRARSGSFGVHDASGAVAPARTVRPQRSSQRPAASPAPTAPADAEAAPAPAAVAPLARTGVTTPAPEASPLLREAAPNAPAAPAPAVELPRAEMQPRFNLPADPAPAVQAPAAEAGSQTAQGVHDAGDALAP